MELGNISELPSQIAVPFIVESKNALYRSQMALKSPAPAWLTEKGYDLLNYLSRRLSPDSEMKLYDIFLNPNTYNAVKTFRPFTIVETPARFDYYDPKTNIKLKKGQPYLAIHLIEEKGEVTRELVRWALGRLAVYIENHRDKIPGNLVIGLTYRRLASAARAYGFTLAETPLPVDIQEKLAKGIKRIAGVDASNISLCFQSFDDITARFSPK